MPQSKKAASTKAKIRENNDNSGDAWKNDGIFSDDADSDTNENDEEVVTELIHYCYIEFIHHCLI